MTSGQALSGDFMISMAIFLFVIAIILPTYSRLSDQAAVNTATRDAEIASIFATDTMLKTGGYPPAWNSTNVQAIGLANPGTKMNITKLRNFLLMNYSTARDLLSLEGLDFNLTITDISGYRVSTGVARSPVAYLHAGSGDITPAISGKGVVWDLYYAGAGQPYAGDARHVHTGSAQAMFADLMKNRTMYKSIVIENSGLAQNSVDDDQLKDFVKTGGLLVVEGDADLISSNFSVSASSGAGSPGIVKNTDFILALYDSAVSFDSPSWYLSNSAGNPYITSYVVDAGDSSRILSGSWKLGFGKVYYITDINGTSGAARVVGLAEIIGTPAIFGKEVSPQKTLSITNRIALLDEREYPIKMTMVIWHI